MHWTSNGQFVPLEPWVCFVFGLVFLAKYIKIAVICGDDNASQRNNQAFYTG